VQKEYGARAYAHAWEKPIVESREAAFRTMLTDTGDFYGEIVGLPALVVRMLLWYAGGTYSGLRVDETVEEGKELDFGVRVLCRHTPGHTPGHMGYYIPDEKVFVGGDLIDLETGTGADLNNPHSDYADGLATLEKVRAMDVEVFLPAHGKPVIGRDNIRPLLDRMIENTHAYIRDVTGFLAERDGTLTEIFNRLMPGTPFTLKAMKMMQILTTLKHLERMGRVSVQKKDGRQVWKLER
jgi:glyoxylase-like metal-dependent hydrolase (beta-lactamase superfamily II)